jgi:hypothetical protein
MMGFMGLGPKELIVCAFFTLFGIFWLWMLVDCLQRAPAIGNDKIVWILVIVLLGPLGALLYLLIQRPKWPPPS